MRSVTSGLCGERIYTSSLAFLGGSGARDVRMVLDLVLLTTRFS